MPKMEFFGRSPDLRLLANIFGNIHKIHKLLLLEFKRDLKEKESISAPFLRPAKFKALNTPKCFSSDLDFSDHEKAMNQVFRCSNALFEAGERGASSVFH